MPNRISIRRDRLNKGSARCTPAGNRSGSTSKVSIGMSVVIFFIMRNSSSYKQSGFVVERILAATLLLINCCAPDTPATQTLALTLGTATQTLALTLGSFSMLTIRDEMILCIEPQSSKIRHLIEFP
uniref:(northern house mosquito) hypothetical protein n=1 Tax=Culex pipiens TaxID=7175 RepID=A0A8D8FAQ1_CULPI